MTGNFGPQEPQFDPDQAAAEFRRRYHGPSGDSDPAAAMAELAPEITRLVDGAVYGVIYNRPAADLKTRSLCAVAALVVLGHSPEMLKQHVTGALNAGATREEISEIIGQMVFYGGMPAAARAFTVAREAFDHQTGQQAGPQAGWEAQQGAEPGAPPSAPGAGPRPGRGVSGVAVYRPRVGPDLDQPPREDSPAGRPAGNQSGRRERDETRVHRDRQHGQSDGRQPDQGRPPTDRPRPATRGRNQPAGDGRRLGGQPKGGRPGQRGGANVPARSQGRRGGGPGGKRNTGRRR